MVQYHITLMDYITYCLAAAVLMQLKKKMLSSLVTKLDTKKQGKRVEVENKTKLLSAFLKFSWMICFTASFKL